jgi:predicted metalloendopeptidase
LDTSNDLDNELIDTIGIRDGEESTPLPTEPNLPGLSSFTNDQLFFIGFAQGWCETKTIGALITQLIADPHPPAKARVTTTLKNMEEFQTAFKCKKSDDMVPKERCRIW